MCWRRAGLVAVLLTMLAPLGAFADALDWQVCAQAGTAAEQRFGIPDGLLGAIGKVESGRTGPGGRTAPWPWTINAAGVGHVLPNREAAVAAVRGLLAGGIASIDVGCFQVNLMYHPSAFASLDEAFDPAANALYAARFLTTLRARGGSWETAVAAYHSATPAHGLPYRDRVLAAWNGAAPLPGGWNGAVPPTQPTVLYGVRVVVPVVAGTAPGVIALRPVGGLPVMVRSGS